MSQPGTPVGEGVGGTVITPELGVGVGATEPPPPRKVATTAAVLFNVRALLALLCSVVTTLGAFLYNYPAYIVVSVFLFTLTYFLQAVYVPLTALLTGSERVDLTASLGVLSQFIYIIAGAIFLFISPQFIWLILASFISLPILIGITLNDGRSECAWDCDRGAIRAGKPQHVVVTVDGGPKVITFVVDGILCDGGDERQFGWGRYSPNLRTPNGSPTLKIAPAVRGLRLYNRALSTSEAVGNFRAGK